MQTGVSVLVPLCLLACSVGWAQSATKPTSSNSKDADEFHLHAAEIYEANGQLEKAEREYLKAGESSSPAIQEKALDGLRCVQDLEGGNQLRLALVYENQRQWSKAETHFAEAAKGAQSPGVRNAALNGLTRVYAAQHPSLKRALEWTDSLPILARLLFRVLAVSLIFLLLLILVIVTAGKFQAMDIHPFEGNEELANRVSIAFPAVRAKVATILGASGLVVLPQVVQTVFPFVSPRLNELLPQEAFELGGIKVPNLGPFLRWFSRPRFEINGGVLRSTNSYQVYVEVWRRRFWFSSRLASVVTRRIPVKDLQNKRLEILIIAVYLEAYAALRA